MNAPTPYYKRLWLALTGQDISLNWVEVCLFATLTAIVVLNTFDSLEGANVGNEKAILSAKENASQDLISQRDEAFKK
jgi:hypothetical protein